MECLLCALPEMQGNKRMPVKHPSDVTGIICSNCIQVLLTLSQEKIKAAYQLALDKGKLEKAKVLSNFLEEELIENGETKKSYRNMDRERTVRKTQSSHHKIRSQQAAL